MSSVGNSTWFLESENNDMLGMPSGTSTESNVYSIPEKDVETLDNMPIKMSPLSVSNAAQPLSFDETTQREYTIASFIEKYQNELPLVVMIKKGYLGDTDSNSLYTGQVLRIHGVHSERRVLAKVTKDSRNCFGFGDVTLSIPVAFPIPMCFVKKSGSSKTAKPLKKIIKNHTLPVTVQLIDTRGHDIKLTGKMVLLTGDVELRLLKEYEGKYIYGNLVKTGEVYRNVISVPSCEPSIRLSVITGLASHNNDHWQSILGLMDHTVTKYIKFDGNLCNTEIFDCSSPDFKIENVLDKTSTEPDSKHSSDPDFKIEKVLDETFTEPDNKHSSDPDFKIEKVLDKTFTEPDNKHSSDPDFKIEKVLDETFTEPDNKDSSDPEFSIGLPSTRKSDEMVAVGKPPVPNIRSEDIGGPRDINSLSVQDLGQYLHILNFGQYAEQLSDAQINGTLLKELDEKVLVEKFGFKRIEAITLMLFARHGYLPNNYRRKEP